MFQPGAACLSAIVTLAMLPAAAVGQSVANLDSTTEIVYLRKDDCNGYPSNRCVVDDLSGLNTWIWGTWFKPAQLTRYLLVDIGPGEFTGNINCNGKGRVTFRGAGREHTKIIGNGIIGAPPNDYTFAVRSSGCDDLGFQDLALLAYNANRQGIAVYWISTSAGTSSWTNVDMEGDQSAWYETCQTAQPSLPPLGEHYFFGNRFLAGSAAVWAECDLTWIYGSDILVAPDDNSHLPDGGTSTSTFSGVRVGGRADVRLFGTTVRVTTKNRTVSTGFTSIQGVEVGVLSVGPMPAGYGDFHSHGGITNVDAGNLAGVSAVGLRVEPASGGDAMAHAHETAFNLKPGSGGSVVRISGTGHVHSPFLWDAHAEPPSATFQSQTGQDIYVETDCSPTDCNGGSDTHLMIYNASCTPSPWFDVVRGECRQ